MGILEAAAFLAVGAATGAVYCYLLLRAVSAPAGELTLVRLLPLSVLRVAGIGSVFWGVVQYGAMPLLVALSGFLMARYAIQYRAAIR